MNLICFSNNTGGGLLCSLLNKTYHPIIGYSVDDCDHPALKTGDSPSVVKVLDYIKWKEQVEKYHNRTDNWWYGTHNHPSLIPNLSDFSEVISITTESRQDKLFRWLRYYNGWFKKNHPDFVEDGSLDSIDKIRSLAKNVFDPFVSHNSCTNIPFSAIVDGSIISKWELDEDYFQKWKDANPFLYDNNGGTSWAIDRFNEAEYEIETNEPYRYY